MISFELLARFRKELSITGSALYDTVVAIAERVNRKVHVLRLHSQATFHLTHIQSLHCQLGARIADHLSASPGRPGRIGSSLQSDIDITTMVAASARQVRHFQDSLARIEAHIRELKQEVAHEELLLIQRDLGFHDAAMERAVVSQGAAVLGHPLSDFNLPPTTRIVAIFRGPFLLSPTGALVLRPDDVVLLVGLRIDLAEILPHFQHQRSSKTA
ncbi:MAG: TrkA C-terminal domain-containing protein [Nitrospiraceae bacterium]